MALSRNQQTVLAVLAETGGEHSGLQLAEIVGSLGRSSIYAALNALQRDGMVSARWDFEESHPRKMMKINARGQQALTQAEQAQHERQTRARQSRGHGGTA